MANNNRRLILGSQSPYRRELLTRLNLPFEAVSHGLEERVDPTLSPQRQVAKLAVEKAENLRSDYTDALIIGSDQGLVANGRLLGKPGSVEGAVAQLAELSGGTWDLVTALTVLDSRTGEQRSDAEVHRMTFRSMSRAEIEHYVATDRPLDCAGSFRIESLGIALFTRIEGEDPTAIMGLPLLKLVDLLACFGVSPLSPMQ